MIGDIGKFTTLTYYDRNNVRFGNDDPYLIKGKHSIKLIENISCYNAHYVEELNYYNFLSVSQLSNVGCKVEFGNKTTKIYDTNENLIGKGDQTRSNLFYLELRMPLVLLLNLMMCGYGIKGYVMSTLTT